MSGRSVGCRVAKILYEPLDKPALKALPPYRNIIRRAKVSPDYHVRYSKHTYSVPHALVSSQIDIEAGARLIRLYHRGALVARHPRCSATGWLHHAGRAYAGVPSPAAMAPGKAAVLEREHRQRHPRRGDLTPAPSCAS